MDETVELDVEDFVRDANPVDLAGTFEQRLVESGTLAFRIAYAVLRHREDAEDVAQEALIRAQRALPKLRDHERFRPWLVRICWRLAVEHRRSRVRRERRESAAVELPGPSAEEIAIANDFRAGLWRAIDRLPEKLRIVTVLAGIHGHALQDVAVLLELPEGTVKSRLHLARKRLAEMLR